MKVIPFGRGQDFAEEVAVGGILVSPGVVALATIAVTRTVTTPGASAAAVTLLAANPARIAAYIKNNGSTNLHIAEPVNAQTLQTPTTGSVIAPGASYALSDGQQGLISGWWEGSPTGNATVTELT